MQEPSSNSHRARDNEVTMKGNGTIGVCTSEGPSAATGSAPTRGEASPTARQRAQNNLWRVLCCTGLGLRGAYLPLLALSVAP